MDNKHLHAILQEIGANINCKQCGAKLDINNVKLLGQADNSAKFEVKCLGCGGMMQISAEMTNSPVNGMVNQVNSSVQNSIEIKNDQQKVFLKGKVSDTLIRDEEIGIVSNILGKISSFKDIFGVFLIFITIFFSGCSKSDSDLKGSIDDLKGASSKIMEDSKKLGSEAYESLKNAPDKVKNLDKDVKDIIKEADNLKKDAENKIKKTREAVDKVNKAAASTKDALDAIGNIAEK